MKWYLVGDGCWGYMPDERKYIFFPTEDEYVEAYRDTT